MMTLIIITGKAMIVYGGNVYFRGTSCFEYAVIVTKGLHTGLVEEETRGCGKL